MDEPLHNGALQWQTTTGIGSIRAGATGGTNEEKLDQTDHVPGSRGS